MSDQWKYQLRITMPKPMAEIARSDQDDPALKPLTDILNQHSARLRNQLDAFTDYVAWAEANGEQDSTLCKWTRATIEKPDKQARYKKVFTIHVDGDEVYDAARADPLEHDLQPLVGGTLVDGMTRHDTNPANNPQAPRKYR
ncbi:MAG: hypothetical protein WBD37_09500 [Anderseniella sp.]